MFYVSLSYSFGYGLKFVRAKHSATAESENCTYGPTLVTLNQISRFNFYLRYLSNAYLIIYSILVAMEEIMKMNMNTMNQTVENNSSGLKVLNNTMGKSRNYTEGLLISKANCQAVNSSKN